MRLDGGDRRHAGNLAPGEEVAGGAATGPSRVQVADIGSEEFEEAHAGTIAGSGDESRECGLADRDEPVHISIPSRKDSCRRKSERNQRPQTPTLLLP